MFRTKVPGCMLLVVLSVLVTSCSSPLNIRYVPLENPDNHLAAISPVKIKLMHLVDKREDKSASTLIGEVKTGIRVGREDVRSANPVADILYEAMKAEFTRNGHAVVDDNEGITIKGDLKHFWLKTDINSQNGSTPDYWDIIAEIKIVLEVTNISKGTSGIFGPYYAKNIEQRYLMPDASTMKRVFEGALSKLMKTMSSDSEFASVLKQ